MFSIPNHDVLRQRLAYPGPGKLRVVIDTDAYNEVDDQFAIAWALKSPERLAVEAVYAAPFCTLAFAQMLAGGRKVTRESVAGIAHFAETPAEGMQQSYEEIKTLFKLMGEDPEGRVYRGSERYIGEDMQPVESEAARDLVNRAMASDEPLYVLAIGAITNVASAILMEPKIRDKIVVVWLGGQPLHFPRAFEFNLSQDMRAARVIFDSGVPVVLVPCMTVASHLTTTAEELEGRLKGKSPVGTYLTDTVLEVFAEAKLEGSDNGLMKKVYLAGQDDTPDEVAAGFTPVAISKSRIIWDISVVGYLLSPNWALTTLVPSPVLRPDCSWSRDEARHPIRVCNYLSRDHIFGDMFAKLEKA